LEILNFSIFPGRFGNFFGTVYPDTFILYFIYSILSLFICYPLRFSLFQVYSILTKLKYR
jgi:hypothetical protein